MVGVDDLMVEEIEKLLVAAAAAAATAAAAAGMDSSVDFSALEMSQAEYARHRGVSRHAINKLVKAGKITLIDRNGRMVIDAAMVDRALGTRERVIVRDEAAAAPVPVAQEGAGLTRA